MKVIQISEENFNRAFEKALDKLRMDLLEAIPSTTLQELHRKFNYEIHILKSELEKS